MMAAIANINFDGWEFLDIVVDGLLLCRLPTPPVVLGVQLAAMLRIVIISRGWVVLLYSACRIAIVITCSNPSKSQISLHLNVVSRMFNRVNKIDILYL